MIRQDTWPSPDPAQTYAWGVRLGMFLRPGDLLGLYGELGTGKTLVAQGIGHALGVTGPITSPTFTMIQHYEGQKNLVHMDLYRLRDPREADIIGIWDFIGEDSVALIEWPQIIADQLPPDRYELHMTGSGETPRGMCLSFLGNRAGRWCEWKRVREAERAREISDNRHDN